MEMQKKDWIWLAGGFGVVIVIGVGIYFVFKPKNEINSTDKNDKKKPAGKSGSSKNTADADTGEAKIKIEGATDPWDVNYYKDISAQMGGKVRILTQASALKLAAQIYDAKGIVYDTEEDVFKAIGSLKSKAQLSYLAEQFQIKYGKDMREYIKSFLSEDEEFPQVNRIVVSLAP